VVNPSSVSLLVDGAAMPATVAGPVGTEITIDYTLTTILDPLSIHTLALAYQDNNLGRQTNSWSFTVANYQNIFLPANPIYSENFDLVPEGGLPAGWVSTNWTDTLNAGLNLDDPLSDSYNNWVAINVDHYTSINTGSASYTATDTYTTPGQPPCRVTSAA